MGAKRPKSLIKLFFFHTKKIPENKYENNENKDFIYLNNQKF